MAGGCDVTAEMTAQRNAPGGARYDRATMTEFLSDAWLEEMDTAAFEKAADLGNEEWVDLRLSMNQSFVPKLKGVNANDDRELALMVYHLYVGEADKLGEVPSVVDATPVSLPPIVASNRGDPDAGPPLADVALAAEAIRRVVDAAPGVRVAILQGAGGAFCAGLDVKAGPTLGSVHDLPPAVAMPRIRQHLVRLQECDECFDRAR